MSVIGHLRFKDGSGKGSHRKTISASLLELLRLCVGSGRPLLFAVIAMGLSVPAERANAASESRFAGQAVSHGGFEIAWTNLGNVISDNDLDANTDKVPSGFDSDEIHDYLRSRTYGFTIPVGATILGIEVQVEIFDGNATNDMDESDARLVKADVLVGADRSMAATWPSTRTVRTYGSPIDLWGTTWTPAEVNAAGFGFAVQPRALSGGTGAVAYVDYHRIIVYFTGVEPTKAFGTDPIAPGGVSTLTLTIDNSYPFALTGGAVSDTYPIEIINATPNNGATTCVGGIVTAVDGGPSVSLSGATIPASGSCTVTVDVTSFTPGGPYINTTSTVTTNEVPPSDTASDSLTVTAIGAVTSAIAEIAPNDVATNSVGNAFSYDILATIGGGDTGVDRVAIAVPGSFGAPTVSDVLVGGLPVAYTDNTVGNDISVDLTAKVTVTDRITVLFDADAPTTQDLTGVDILSTVDDSTTGIGAQATTEGNGDGDAGDANSWTVTTTDAVIILVKRAFLPDGTPMPTGSTIPGFIEYKYLLYINNPGSARSDVSVRDVLDAAFQYQTGTIQVDNSVAECALAVCTAAEELTIFTAVDGAAFLTDAVDGDVGSYTGVSTSVDAGNQNVGNLRLDINADSVWAILFSVKLP